MTPEQIDLTFTRLSQLSRAYGAPAVDMAERVLQRAAVGQLVGGAVFLLGGVALGFGAAWCIRRLKKSDYSDADTGYFFGALFGTILAAVGLIAGVLMLSDVWAWTALTDPSLALARDIYGSISR